MSDYTPPPVSLAFTQTGTGAIANTIDVKLKQVVDARDFGVVADGTTDDRAALQAAIDAATASGTVPGTVILPKGTILITAGSTTVETKIPCIQLRSYLTLKGAGKYQTAIKVANSVVGDRPCLFAATTQSTRITICDLEVNGNATGRSLTFGGEDEGINFKSGSFISVHDCYIHDCGQDGIDCDAGSDIDISGVHSADNKGNGIHLAGGGVSRVTVRGCLLRNNAFDRLATADASVAASASGIDCKVGTLVSITGCTITDNARGVTVLGGTNISITGCVIFNSTAYNAVVIGRDYGASTTTNPASIVVSGNYIAVSAAADAMVIQTYITGVTASGNVIRSSGGSGITINQAGDLTISGNDIAGASSLYGVYVQTLSTGKSYLISGNTVSLASTGIRLASGDRGAVTNNLVRDCVTAGIGVFGAGGVTIKGNTCRNNGTYSIRAFSGAGANIIEQNDCDQNITMNVGSNIVRGNRCATMDFAAGGATSNVIENNRISTSVTFTTATAVQQTWSGNSGAGTGVIFGYFATATNDSAQAGQIGEYVSASVVQGSALALTTATPKTVTSISLTAGDWDVTGIGCITGASTGTEFDVAVGTTTNSFTGTVLGDTRAQTPTVSLAGADATLMIPAVRISLSGTTTVYLIVQETFTVGSPAAYGRISARRVR